MPSDEAKAREPASSHDSADWFEQRGFDLRFGWGPNGLRRLAPEAGVVVVVDVMSFSTAVDVALGRGATVLPYRWHDGTEEDYAEANNAVVASRTPAPGALSLRPSSLQEVEAGVRLVLPSPNGSALAFGAVDAGAGAVMVGSLRNATAVGRAAARFESVAVVAAGERWRGATGPLRPAIEDLLGAGAILAATLSAPADSGRSGPVDSGPSGEAVSGSSDPGSRWRVSPEARTAIAAFVDAAPELAERLTQSGSGRELVGKGRHDDVALACELDCSQVVPVLDGVELVDGLTGVEFG
jgi:2-phosphosulfolactate phosphatase